ncbi:MAG: hypothetical protein ACI85K_002725, partial [Hyphomicrobiaceae bacterium]
MATKHAWVLGTLTALTTVSAATVLLPAGDVAAPQLVAPMAAANAPRSSDAPPRHRSQRLRAPSVRGIVVDLSGQPVADMRVAMRGTTDITYSAPDGSFTFRTANGGRCLAIPKAGWLAIDSALLDVCTSDDAPLLVVARSGQPHGRVVTVAGDAIAGAHCAVDLHIELTSP